MKPGCWTEKPAAWPPKRFLVINKEKWYLPQDPDTSMRSQTRAQKVTGRHLMAPRNTNKEKRVRCKLLEPPEPHFCSPRRAQTWEGKEGTAPMRSERVWATQPQH